MGKQDVGGESPIRGWLTPAMRATMEAVLAKLAAPGMANPNEPCCVPIIVGVRTQAAMWPAITARSTM
jgi:hypothetical protein